MLPKSSSFSCYWRINDRLIVSLRPFIVGVSESLARGEELARAVAVAAKSHPGPAAEFEFDPSDAKGTFGLKRRHLFREDDVIDQMIFGVRDQNALLRLQIPPEGLGEIADLLYRSGSACFSAAELHRELADDLHPVLDRLIDCGFLAGHDPAELSYRWDVDAPGITRLQHASLLYRTKKASVLVDPHFHSDYAAPVALNATVGLSDLRDEVDAIVISHGHGDHFYLPTLMLFSRDIPIIVPKVPRATILCDDFAVVLASLGFRNVIPLEWHAPPYAIGDIEVHALPFYGEQPLLYEGPRDRDLRNWGNTYVVRCDGFCSWTLIDSGDDAAGCMASVAEEVRSRFGPIDFLLSNLRPFGIRSPFYITGSGHYWLSLTTDQMQRFHLMRNHCVTLGPPGVAKVCSIVGARYFLPYAHWWGELGEPPQDDEVGLVGQLIEELKHVGADTRILSWKIGDQLRVRRNGQFDFVGPTVE